MEKDKKKRPWSKLLIALGCICIMIPIGVELSQYPWATLIGNANERVLPTPAPPSVPFLMYDTHRSNIEDDAVSQPVYDYESDNENLYDESYEDLHEDLYFELPGEEEQDVIEASGNSGNNIYVWMGSIQIPKISISVNFFEGTERQMNYGAGFLIGSALPGKEGNSVISAHRVSSVNMQPFRHLDKLETGDHIIIHFNDDIITYVVYDSFIVPKEDVWVLYPVPEEKYLLTLVTCDPVVYATSRPDRLIIRARMLNVHEELNESEVLLQ